MVRTMFGLKITGNVANKSFSVSYIDKTKPTVTFTTNGSSIYAKSRSTKVTISDSQSGINTGSLKYLWNTSTSIFSESSFSMAFTNGGTISTPSGVSGSYYLCGF